MKKLILFTLFTLFLFVIYIPESTDAKAPTGSTIANVNVSGKTDSEIEQLLNEEITHWQSGDDLQLQSEFEQLSIPRTVFEFNIKRTMEVFKEKTKRSITSFFRKPKNVHVLLDVQVNEGHASIQSLKSSDYIAGEKTVSHLTDVASNLDTNNVSLNYQEGAEVPLTTIAETELNIPSLSNAVLNYAIDDVNELIIRSNDVFSFKDHVTFPNNLQTSNEEVSFLATGLYMLFIQTNVEIVKRNAGSSLPSYAKPGLDVIIDEQHDLMINNPNDFSIKIKASRKNDKLILSLESAETNHTYKFSMKNKEGIKPRTLYRYSNKLKPGEQKIIQHGENGITVDVYREIYKEDNQLEEVEFISHDVYVPKPKIVLVSTEDEIIEEEVTEDEMEEDMNQIEDLVQGIGQALGLDNTEKEEEDEGENDGSVVDSPINIVPIDQLEEILKKQNELQKRISEMEEKFDTYSGSVEEDMDSQYKHLNERYNKLKEQYEGLLQVLLDESLIGDEVKSEK